jgi:hypothetical protein
VNEDVLVYGHQDFGINLRNVKTKEEDGPRNVTFQRQSGATGPLKYGERVALYMRKKEKKGEFIYYTKRDVGPNLGWSKEPKYEWEIRGGSQGEAIKTDVPVGLFSTIENDYLVYCERPLSVNLRWAKDKESKGCHGAWGLAKEKGKALLKKSAEYGGRVGGAAVGGPVGAAVGGELGKKVAN